MGQQPAGSLKLMTLKLIVEKEEPHVFSVVKDRVPVDKTCPYRSNKSNVAVMAQSVACKRGNPRNGMAETFRDYQLVAR